MEIKNFNTAHDLNAILNEAYDSNQRVKLVGENAIAVFNKPVSVFGKLANWLRDISGINRREHNQVVDAFQRLVDLVPDVAIQKSTPKLQERTPSIASPTTSEQARAELNTQEVKPAETSIITLELESPDKSPEPVKLPDDQKKALKIDAAYLERLDNTIAAIERSANSERWSKSYIGTTEFAPALAALENQKKPNLNLRYCGSVAEFRDAVRECINQKTPNARFIVRYEGEYGEGQHVSYFDYQAVDGKPSVLQLDSATYRAYGPAFLLGNAQIALHDLDPNIRFAGIEISAQNSSTECPIFAVNTAKQIYKNPQSLDHLHELNAQDRLLKKADEENPYKRPFENVDALLPPNLLKHAQSSTRLESYLKEHPDAASQPVNAKGKTVKQYQEENSIQVTPDDKKHTANSIFRKRLEYLKELRVALS